MIGVIGTGRMGLPICARLAGAGHEVLATDRRAECAAAVQAAGAEWSASGAELLARADVVLTVLPGSHELVAAMGEIVAAMRPGTTWIDMTSADPQAAAPLAGMAARRGIDCLEAPMGGGATGAASGRLELFVGGAQETLERHRALLECLGRVHHVGGPGAGYTTKLLVNLLWFAQAVATGEALLIARASGIDLAVLQAVLAGSAAESRFVRESVPGLLEGDYLRSFGLDGVSEELEAITSLAARLGAPHELASVVRHVHERALARYGPVPGELAGIELLEDESGIRLCSREADGTA